ncbi:extracellular solute-binding protein [Rhodoferax ferrireducens]|uniref:extracellular solute-binding protein n=1 Tax=Rhodoferax ferrireducens TaxID=192843 RepID=UPI000E0DD2B3|nr:extracellular solute-binding protein [Rhodoferax ferrireducens]
MIPRLLTILVAGLALSLPSQAVETLRVLTWPGYADSDLVKAFEKKYDARVEVSFVSSDEVLREKIGANQGGDFDVFAANTAEMQHYIDQKLVVPLRLSNIPNTAQQLPRFRDARSIPGITQLGEVYAVPYTYSEMGLIYDRKQFEQAPTSLSVLWDPKYRGRVLAYDTSSHNFSIAALALGDKPFRIEEAKFKAVVDHLIALRRNVLTFYTLPEESVELFRNHAVAVMFANYGSQQLKLLRDAGADVGYVIPVEGALAWLDCWAVTRGGKNKNLAESWINYMLDKHVSRELTRRQGLSNTLDVDTATQETDKIIWLEPVEDDKRRAALWGRIISGDLPGRF